MKIDMTDFPILKPMLDILRSFDERNGGFDLHELSQALGAARSAITDVPEDAFRAAANDLIAFEFEPYPRGSPWNTYFGPLATFEKPDGGVAYHPDQAWLDTKAIEQWRERATTLNHPLLKARYADLVWDLGTLIDSNNRRDGKMGNIATIAYIEASQLADLDLIYAYQASQRGLGLAIAMNNPQLRDRARSAILVLYERSKIEDGRHYDAYDILISQPKSGLTDEEHSSFIADLEAGLARHSDAAEGTAFDPHHVQGIAQRLLAYYRREKRVDDERRVHGVVARATEHFASLGNALLASSVLNDAMTSYRDAGLDKEAERVRRLMEAKVREANSQMTSFRHEIRITFEEVAAFKAEIVVDDPAITLGRIAFNFLIKRSDMEALVEQEAKVAPLQAIIGQEILGERYQVASVGSTGDDPYGRIMRHAVLALQVKTPWLGWAMEAAMDRHKFELRHIAGWSNRAGLFGDGMLLCAGVDAWLSGDDLKAIHILIPQVERALRNLVEVAGRPGTKPHPRFRHAQTAITIGDIIYSKETIAALGDHGQDLAVHLAALYADPRGMNLRNELAHGLLDWRQMHPGTTLWVIHSLLLLGLWRMAAEATSEGTQSASTDGSP